MTPIVAAAAPPRVLAANQIAPYRATQAGKVRQPLGELFGLKTFGVNRTTLAPGAVSALFHRHEREDEFVYVLVGELVLRYGSTQMLLTTGMCMGFPPAARHTSWSTDRAPKRSYSRSATARRSRRSIIPTTI